MQTTTKPREWTTQDLLSAVNTARSHALKAGVCALVALIFGALAIVGVLYGEPDFAGAAAVSRGGGKAPVTLCEDDAANDAVKCDPDGDGDFQHEVDVVSGRARLVLRDASGANGGGLQILSGGDTQLRTFAAGAMLELLSGAGLAWDLANDGTDDATWTESGADGMGLATDHLDISASKSSGTITLSSGTGTATTFSGAVCVCSNTSTQQDVQCSVSSTTLTADDGTGTSSSVVAYACF